MIAVVTLNSDIDIWNIETMKKITLKGHDDIVNALIFSNNSNTLITGGREGIIKVWK
jgi:WD40 repeat protein